MKINKNFKMTLKTIKLTINKKCSNYYNQLIH